MPEVLVRLFSLAAALFCVVSAVQSWAADEVTAPTPASPTADPDRMICTMETPTGSNIRRRVCMTAAQRAAVREQSREALTNMGRKNPSRGGS